MREANPNLRLIIVGDGPFYQDLYANERDVVFCGMQTGEALATHYASADMFLFPSETETFGNVTLEALASGLAVVAFGDHEAFINTARELAADRDRVAALGVAARRKSQRLDWQGVADRFEWLLREYSKRGAS